MSEDEIPASDLLYGYSTSPCRAVRPVFWHRIPRGLSRFPRTIGSRTQPIISFCPKPFMYPTLSRKHAEPDHSSHALGRIRQQSSLKCAPRRLLARHFHFHVPLLGLQGLTCGTYQRPNFGWDAIAVTAGLCLLLVFIVYATCADLINVSLFFRWVDAVVVAVFIIAYGRGGYG